MDGVLGVGHAAAVADRALPVRGQAVEARHLAEVILDLPSGREEPLAVFVPAHGLAAEGEHDLVRRAQGADRVLVQAADHDRFGRRLRLGVGRESVRRGGSLGQLRLLGDADDGGHDAEDEQHGKHDHDKAFHIIILLCIPVSDFSVIPSFDGQIKEIL